MKQLVNDLLKTIIEASSDYFSISYANIEKDIHICKLLKRISENEALDHTIFRGGTSLSKCWNVVDRFSEDIDYSIIYPIGDSKRRRFKYELIDICNDLNLDITNINEIRSRRTMNRYDIKYPSIVENDNSIIYLEMSAFSISLFSIEKEVQSYIGEYLDKNTNVNSKDYGLEPFVVKTQTLEKTFADKVFALCDYALTSRFAKGSRHIYDLYKIYPLLKDNPELHNIITITRYDRMKRERRPSSYPDCDVSKLLMEIVETECFKNDYNNVTIPLLNKEVSYDVAIKIIKDISESTLFKYEPDFSVVDYLIDHNFINKRNNKEIKLYTDYYAKPIYQEKVVSPKSIKQ